MAQRHRLHVLLADARKIHQALADAADALRDAQHARQAFQRGRVVGGLGELFDGALQDGERRVQLMRDAGAQQAQADQAVLRLQLAERFLQILFALAKLDDGGVARAHDLADFVAGDEGFVDQLALAIAMLGGLIGIQHELQRPIHVQRHDGGFEHQHGQDVDGAQHDEQVGFGVVGQVGVQREVNADGEDQEEDVVQHHQLEAHLQIAEEPGDALGRHQPSGTELAGTLRDCVRVTGVPVLYDSTLARRGLGIGILSRGEETDRMFAVCYASMVKRH